MYDACDYVPCYIGGDYNDEWAAEGSMPGYVCDTGGPYDTESTSCDPVDPGGYQYSWTDYYDVDHWDIYDNMCDGYANNGSITASYVDFCNENFPGWAQRLCDPNPNCTSA